MSRFSVKKPMTVLVAVILILVTGVVAFTKMQTDLLPSMDLPYVVIITSYPGASPDEVEMTITKPLEQSMATISNVNSISSISNEHLSLVIMEFSESANMDTATIDIRESLDLIEAMWTNDRIGSPIIYKINPDMLPIMIAAVDVEDMDNVQISKYLDSDVLPRLESVEGVASVSASGLIEEKINLFLRQDKIDKLNQSIKDSILEKFAASEDELNKALEEINKAKSELELGAAQLELFPDTESELYLTKKAELDAAMEQVSAGEAEITSGQEVLNETKQTALSSADIENILNIDMLTGILTAQNFAMPAGYVSNEDNRYLVRVGDKFSSKEEIEELVLFDMNIEGIDPIKVSDVADVLWIDNSKDVYAKVNGNDAIVLTFEKQNSYATAKVTDQIKERFNELTDSNNKLHVTYLMDQGLYIDVIVNSVLNNLIIGAILAILILLVFLKDIRPTLIVAISIPVSVIFAVVLMYFSGITLNIISLSGLAVGVGMLVDNSIVVIENIFRLRQKGVSAVKAAVSGAVQVTGAIIASTLTTVCVFVPIVFVEGITKQLFVDMALTIGYSLLASLIIAITVVPAMSAGLMKSTKEHKNRLMNLLAKGYEKAITWCLRFRFLTLIIVLALLAGSVALAFSKGTAFMPEMDSPQLTVNINFPEELLSEKTGEELTREERLEMVDEAMTRIGTIDDIDSIGVFEGGGLLGSMGGDMGGMLGTSTSGESMSMYVLLKDNKKNTSQDIAKNINELCEDMACEVNASGSNMDISMLSGSGLTYNIKGADSTVLIDIARKLAEKLSELEGVEEVNDGIKNPTTDLKITVDKEKAILNNLTVAQVYLEISEKLAEEKTATTLSTGSNEYPVIAYGIKDYDKSVDFIKDYTFDVTGMDGSSKQVKLSDIATITTIEGLSSISRRANQRYLSVSATIKDGYNVGLVGNDAEKIVDELELPDGYSIETQGENKMINDSMKELAKMLALAICFIYLIMVAQFQSLLSPFIIMFTIPLAFTGGFLGLFLTGNEVSVISVIGFVMISGIIVNNGIVLVDYINILRREGMEKKQALIEAGKTRMRPVLMTALTTVLGLSTMALGIGMGADMVQPIAIVTIGGLLYGTVTTVFVVPVIYDLVNRKELKVVSESELDVVEE